MARLWICQNKKCKDCKLAGNWIDHRIPHEEINECKELCYYGDSVCVPVEEPTIEDITAENVPPECGGTGFLKAPPKIDPSNVRDELITVFCNEVCKDSTEDGHCPDHSCLIWKILLVCTYEDVK
jgi:hypothetical protein